MFQLYVGSGTLTGAWQRTGVAGIDANEVITNMVQKIECCQIRMTGDVQKWLYLNNHQSNWAETTFPKPSWGCLLCCGAFARVSRSWWCQNRHQQWCSITKMGKYSHFCAHIVQILTRKGKWQGMLLPLVFLMSYSVLLWFAWMSSLSLLVFTENKSSLKHESFDNHCHHDL